MNELILGQNETREAIRKLETTMLESGNCTTDFDEYLTHYFAEGVYIREMRIPVGTVLIGKIHKFTEVCVLTKGIMLLTSDNSESRIVEAPYTFIAEPGKKVGYVIENAIFLNIFPNPDNLTDVDKIEERVTLSDYLALEAVS